MAEFASISTHHPSYQGWARRWGLFCILVSLYWKSKFQAEREVNQRLWEWQFSGESPQSFFFLFWEIFILEIYAFDCENTKPKIIDAGANIGLSIAYFKMHYPFAEITAFEPSPQAFFYLEKNISQNGFDQVRLIQAALSDQRGTATLGADPNAPLYNASLYCVSNAKYKHEVSTQVLSAYLSKSTFDLIKLDIEGAERLVIQDLSRNDLLHKSKNYIIEYHPKYHLPEDYTELIEAFKNSNFNFFKKLSGDSVSATGEILQFERFA